MARTCCSFGVEGIAVQLSLAGRTVLVTGGGSGIGKGVAQAVVASGGNAMLVGRNADRLSAVVDEIEAAGPPPGAYVTNLPMSPTRTRWPASSTPPRPGTDTCTVSCTVRADR